MKSSLIIETDVNINGVPISNCRKKRFDFNKIIVCGDFISQRLPEIMP